MTEDMKELITVEQVEMLFRLLAGILFVLGAVLGVVLGRHRWGVAGGLWRGAAVGLVGLANYALWRIYLAITDRLGMDSVANLVVNLALFVAIGCAGGLAYRLCVGRCARETRCAGTPADPKPQS